MDIKDMHYDFKMKLNKVDSQQNRNFLIPEIDWILNEALDIFIRNSAFPKIKNSQGFEKNTRLTEDLRTLVKRNTEVKVDNNTVYLPSDYAYFISGNVLMNKGKCSDVVGRLIIQQNDDMFEEDPFTKSSFEWRVVNAVFTERGIELHTDGTFSNKKVLLTYIKRHPFMNFSSGFGNGEYRLPSGQLINRDCNCLLPEHTHSTIVDIAVAIVSGKIESQAYQLMFNKLNKVDQFE